jgi:peptidoglycan hydrolase-like protein with peptidoglycan-binding domain
MNKIANYLVVMCLSICAWAFADAKISDPSFLGNSEFKKNRSLINKENQKIEQDINDHNQDLHNKLNSQNLNKKRSFIQDAQMKLNSKGFALQTDGVIGVNTQKAIMDFQKREGIQKTGQFDDNTLVALGLQPQNSTNDNMSRSPSSIENDESNLVPDSDNDMTDFDDNEAEINPGTKPDTL